MNAPRKHTYPRVTAEQCDEIKGYVNSRHLLEPRWFDISDCIGALQFDRAELAAALEDNAALRAEVERLREDGERYRWLRDGLRLQDHPALDLFCAIPTPEWDARIDAAMAHPSSKDPIPEMICVSCDGCGWCEGSPAFTCPDCNGNGAIDSARAAK